MGLKWSNLTMLCTRRNFLKEVILGIINTLFYTKIRIYQSILYCRFLCLKTSIFLLTIIFRAFSFLHLSVITLPLFRQTKTSHVAVRVSNLRTRTYRHCKSNNLKWKSNRAITRSYTDNGNSISLIAPVI